MMKRILPFFLLVVPVFRAQTTHVANYLPIPETLFVAKPFGPSPSGFGTFIEGAAVDPATGRIFAVNHRAGDPIAANDGSKGGAIGYLNSNGTQSSLFTNLQQSGTHFNGLQFDKNGDLIAADNGNHKVFIYNPKTGAQKGVFCDLSTVTTIGTPNDLTLTADGNLGFFSGMDWGTATGELFACFRGGSPIKLTGSISSSSNGIQLTIDEKFLLVSQAKTGTGSPNVQILKLGLNVDRKAKNVTVVSNSVLINFNTADGTGGVEVDGMRIDKSNNLWAVRNGGKRVDCISADSGKIVRSVAISMQFPTNLAFGGPDGRTIYVVGRCGQASFGTGDGCIDSFRTNIPGRGC